MSFNFDFSLFIVDDLHALLPIHSSTFHAVQPLTRWMSLNRESRRTVANDKHGARLPSCLPPCKSHTVTSVRRMDHSSHCCTGICTTISVCSIFCSVMLGGRSTAQMRNSSHTLVVSQYNFMNPSSPSPGSFPCFFMISVCSIYLYPPYLTGI
jgi:hypothetical protein